MEYRPGMLMKKDPILQTLDQLVINPTSRQECHKFQPCGPLPTASACT